MVVVAALITALVATPLAMVVARRTGLVDQPGPLKVHEKPVAYLGGVGVAAGLAWGAGTTRPSLLVPLGAALALGIVDDATGLSPLVRLAGELAIGAALGVCIPLGEPTALGVVFAALATVVLCNGVNMVDGLDGLAGGTAAVAAAGFFVALSGDGATMAATLLAALAAFLVFNRPPARVYLGDGGAYLIGTALAALFLLACRAGSGATVRGRRPARGLSPRGAGVHRHPPDTAGRVPLSGDRHHVYDQLHQLGATPLMAALSCVGLQAALVVAGIVVAPRSSTAGVVAAGGCGMMILLAGSLTGFLAPRTRRP